MEKTIKVGPIVRPAKRKTSYEVVRTRLNKMKVGDMFVISGLTKATTNRVRVAINYFSKKDRIKVTTAVKGSEMTVERVRLERRTKSTVGSTNK